MDTLQLWQIIRWMSFLFCHLHWTIESPEFPENPKKNLCHFSIFKPICLRQNGSDFTPEGLTPDFDSF